MREEPVLLQLVPQDTSSLTVAAFAPPPFTLTPGGSSFRWRSAQVSLAVAGAHNVLNAIAALEAARLAGAGEELAAPADHVELVQGDHFPACACARLEVLPVRLDTGPVHVVSRKAIYTLCTILCSAPRNRSLSYIAHS